MKWNPSIPTLCALLSLFGCMQIGSARSSSVANTQRDCVFSNVKKNRCANYCSNSLKPLLKHIRDLQLTIEELQKKKPNTTLKAFSVDSSCKRLPSGIHTTDLKKFDPDSLIRDGWMVIQNRFDGSENFNRSWSDFTKGFGKLNGEYIIGLNLLNCITRSRQYELHIKMVNLNNVPQHAYYDNFKIGTELEKYVLKSLGNFSGTVDNQMNYSLHYKFSTHDRDNDEMVGMSCAKSFYGAWWYNNCGGPNLNGRYYNNGINDNSVMSWVNLLPLKSVQMLIRPKS